MQWTYTLLAVFGGILVGLQFLLLYRWKVDKSVLLTEVLSVRQEQTNSVEKIEKTVRSEMDIRSRASREELSQRIYELQKTLLDQAAIGRQEADQRQESLRAQMMGHLEQALVHQKERLSQVDLQLLRFGERFERSLEELRGNLNQRVELLIKDSQEKLEHIRNTVDEKLQGTLEKRLGESFLLVSSRLEQVHKGLGEMHNLAQGVGDLKRVLGNVKSRGSFAEVQLGALLEQFLHTEQYQKNVQIKPATRESVEYALKLPGLEDGKPVWLPIDAKFPLEDYERLTDAAERGDIESVEKAALAFEYRLKNESKRIFDKYIEPPSTTDFAILYLATEGLYAEALRRPGLAASLQQNYRVLLVGPMALGALLSSLQMGFRTLALQKRSSEVWEVLAEAKREFMRYGQVIEKVKKQLQAANRSLDDVDIRNRSIEKKLRLVEVSPLEEVHVEAPLLVEDDSAAD